MSQEESAWSSKAPEYKKEGEMYCTVECDDEGNPEKVHVAQDQVRKGDFRVEGSKAVYEPMDVLSLSEAGEEVAEYVRKLDFIDEVVFPNR